MWVMSRWPSARSTSTRPETLMKNHAASSKPPTGLRCLVIDGRPSAEYRGRISPRVITPCPPEPHARMLSDRVARRPGQGRQHDPGHGDHDRGEYDHGDPERLPLVIRRPGPEVEEHDPHAVDGMEQ